MENPTNTQCQTKTRDPRSKPLTKVHNKAEENVRERGEENEQAGEKGHRCQRNSDKDIENCRKNTSTSLFFLLVISCSRKSVPTQSSVCHPKIMFSTFNVSPWNQQNTAQSATRQIFTLQKIHGFLLSHLLSQSHGFRRSTVQKKPKLPPKETRATPAQDFSQLVI